MTRPADRPLRVAIDTSPYPVDDPVLSLIGSTPVIDYPEPLAGSLSLKLEKANPTGSMKDRIALGMIREMERSGRLTPDDTIVEASSGNTAGAVALVANRLGYESVITAPETTSEQKLGYVRLLGSELVTCPPVPADHPEHYRNEAERIANGRDAVFLDQYENQLNPLVHEKWTGPELWNQLEGLTHVVCPMGTGGTLSGIGKYLKRQDPSVKIVGVDADGSNISTAFHGEEPVEYDTEIEGLGKEGRTPTMWFEYVDDVCSVDDETALSHARMAAREHGLLIGPSSGAALRVARDIAAEAEDSAVALIACDGAEQYFGTLTETGATR